MKTLKIFKKVKIGAKSVEIIEKVFIENGEQCVSPRKLLTKCFWAPEPAVPAPSRAQRREAAGTDGQLMDGHRPLPEIWGRTGPRISLWTVTVHYQRFGAALGRRVSLWTVTVHYQSSGPPRAGGSVYGRSPSITRVLGRPGPVDQSMDGHRPLPEIRGRPGPVCQLMDGHRPLPEIWGRTGVEC